MPLKDRHKEPSVDARKAAHAARQAAQKKQKEVDGGKEGLDDEQGNEGQREEGAPVKRARRAMAMAD